MPSKYLNDARTGELIQKIYTADRAIATECKSYTDTNYLPLTGGTITGNLTVSGTITGDVTGDLTGNADTATNATNDGNGNQIDTTYLPLSGGTINGQVVINRNNNSTDGGLKFTGAGQNYVINVLNTNVTKGTAPSSNQYWGINFYGKDSDNYNKRIGMLESYLTSANVSLTAIRAYNCTTNTNTANATVEVSVDGSGNQSAKALGKEIERVNASGTRYIRYDSGLQICWGETTNITSATTVTITFPVAFKAYDSYGISIGRWWAASSTENYYLSDRTATAIKLTTVGTVSAGIHSYYYVAVGYWK